MAKEIKQKIVLEGEKEYSNAVKNANRNLKTLRSELKAETAELGANATAQQKAEARSKSLQKQIAEQEKIVKAYSEALSEVKEKYGEDEDATARWEQKLNDARASLAGMRNELTNLGSGLNGTAQGMADVGTTTAETVIATKSLADALEKVGNVGDTISGAIESTMSGIMSKVQETISQIWQSITDLAAKSNGLVDLAGYWNTDVTTLQKYSGAVRAVSGEMSDLNAIVTRINSMDTKKIAELTGVSGEGYADKWEYAMAVLDEMNEMGKRNPESRNAAAFEIFGKGGATRAMDILNDWDKLKTELATFDADKGGFAMSEEDVKAAGDLYDTINKIEEKWKRLKEIGTWNLFGNIAINVAGNADAILDAILEYFNADTPEAQDAAIKKIEDNLVAAFEAIAEGIRKGIEMIDKIAEDLKNSDNPTAKMLGEILGSITDALQWITEDNMKNVVKALEIFIGFWAGAKVLRVVGTVASLAANLKTISGFKGLPHLTDNGGNPPTTTPTAAPTGGGGTTVAAAGKGKGLLSTVGAWLSDGLGMSLTGAGLGAVISAGLVYGGAKAASANNYKWDVQDDRRRYSSWGESEKGIIEATVRGVLQGESPMSQQWQLNWMADNLGLDKLIKLFSYTDTNGGEGNMLMNWLGGHDSAAAAAAFQLMARAGGWSKDRNTGMYQVDSAWANENPMWAALLGTAQTGGTADYSNLWGYMMPYLAGSGAYDENGLWTIPWETGAETISDEVAEAVSGVYKENNPEEGSLEGLPANWWKSAESANQKEEKTLSGLDETLAQLPSTLATSVTNGVAGMSVNIDGRTAGYITAPYVDEWMAANSTQE